MSLLDLSWCNFVSLVKKKIFSAWQSRLHWFGTITHLYHSKFKPFFFLGAIENFVLYISGSYCLNKLKQGFRGLEYWWDLFCQNLILAGSDATMIPLTWTLALLLNNQHVLRKAQEELNFHVGKERCVDESDVKKPPLPPSHCLGNIALIPTCPNY